MSRTTHQSPWPQPAGQARCACSSCIPSLCGAPSPSKRGANKHHWRHGGLGPVQVFHCWGRRGKTPCCPRAASWPTTPPCISPLAERASEWWKLRADRNCFSYSTWWADISKCTPAPSSWQGACQDEGGPGKMKEGQGACQLKLQLARASTGTSGMK